jgi:hypothetical protein
VKIVSLWLCGRLRVVLHQFTELAKIIREFLQVEASRAILSSHVLVDAIQRVLLPDGSDHRLAGGALTHVSQLLRGRIAEAL